MNFEFDLADHPDVNPEFFRHPELWESSRVDGKTQDDLVEQLHTKADFFVTAKVDGELACVLNCNFLRKGEVVEFHGFVVPDYRRVAKNLLDGCMELLSNHFVCAVTCCSDNNKDVQNFLEKRLGFEVFEKYISGNVKVDGEFITVYRLRKVL